MKKRLVLAAAAMTLAMSMPAYAGTWRQDTAGWWYQNEDGSYLANGWEWLDGNQDGMAESYYFDQNGYLLTNTITPDGCQVNENGAWVVNGAVQTQAAVPDEVTVEVPDVVTEGKRQMGVPERVVVDENGTTIRYFNGVPYYTYAKDEEPEETETNGGITYEEIDVDELAYRIIDLVNEERVKVGKSELMVNEELMENARVRAEEAGELGDHIRPDGNDFRTAITVEYGMASENLASIPYSVGDSLELAARDTVAAWLASSGHKQNVLNSKWEETGIGAYKDEKRICIIQLFIKN